MQDKQLRLYAITDSRWLGGASLSEVADRVLQGGATLLQYREKHLPFARRLEEARALKYVADRHGVSLVVNDDVRLAEEIGADGVHLGQKDMAYRQAREILGPDKIIGVTAPSVRMALEAEQMGADYIGAGAVFATGTKQDTTPLSLERLREITDAVSIPVVAIGGIHAGNVGRLKGTGIAGVAVVSGIFGQADPEAATATLLAALKDVFQ